jgi:endonuclease III
MAKVVPLSNAALAHNLKRVCDALEKRYGRRKHQRFTDFIEALIYQILELGTLERAARDALKRLREEYVDWNDMRVATVREIEDILGPRYYLVREKAEDIKHLLADLYTAFRRMEIADLLTPEGIETLRALPETTNVRKDMVECALLQALNVRLFPCDEDQFKLLKFLGGVPKPLTMAQGVKKVEEALDPEHMLRLSHVLREHVHFCQTAGEDEPQIIGFGWDRPDPLGMDKAAKKPARSHRRK